VAKVAMLFTVIQQLTSVFTFALHDPLFYTWNCTDKWTK